MGSTTSASDVAGKALSETRLIESALDAFDETGQKASLLNTHSGAVRFFTCSQTSTRWLVFLMILTIASLLLTRIRCVLGKS